MPIEENLDRRRKRYHIPYISMVAHLLMDN